MNSNFPKQLTRLIEEEVPQHGRNLFYQMWEEAADGKLDAPGSVNNRFHHFPVGIEEFIIGDKYLKQPETIYPTVMPELIELNDEGKYVEAVLTGGIGSGKTTVALYTTAYQLYVLSCFKNPHKEFDLDPTSEIIFIFQSINERLARAVDYSRFKELVRQAPYFKSSFKFDPLIQSRLVFPNRIEVVPVSGQETAAIGENVIGGVIDELNYMDVIEKSKRGIEGGTYDQAVALYNSISRRRKSRFMKFGQLPGVLCLVSSRRYPGQFTDEKEEEAKSDPTIFVYNKRTWDIRPDAFSGIKFPVFIGDEFRKPRFLDPGYDRGLPDEDKKLVDHIPVEFKTSFEKDMINALREIAGVSTLARHPFIMNTEAIRNAMKPNLRCVFSNDWTDFTAMKVKIYPRRFKNEDQKRFAHVDLGLSSDSAGLAVGYVQEFVSMDRSGYMEKLPLIVLDGVLEIKPPKGAEIKFWKVRDVLFKLREFGLPIEWVSYDSYQSVDSLQLLKQQGFDPGIQSIDRTRAPYDMLKLALYDKRLLIPPHVKLQKELASLEDDPATGKIDHPPHGSKDLSDAVAGVVFGLTRRRAVWIRHGVSLRQIPLSIQSIMDKHDTVQSTAPKVRPINV